MNLKNYKYFLLLIPIAFGAFYLDPLLLFLLVAGLSWATFSLLAPEYLAYILVFFYPWIGWDWSYRIGPESFLFRFVGGSIELPLVDLVAILVLGGFLLNTLYRYYYLEDKQWQWRLPAFLSFLAFLLVGFVALRNSDVWFYESLKYLLRPMAFFYLAMLVPLYNLVKRPRQYYYLLWIIFGLGIAGAIMGGVSFLGIFEHIHRAHPLAILGRPYWGLNQNLLAEILIVAIPFSFILFYLEPRHKIKPYIILGILAMAFVTLLTFSRTAWLTLIFGAILAMAFLWKEKKEWFLRWGALLLILLIPLGLSMWAYSFDSYTAQSSNWGRMEMTEFAYFLWQGHPLIGNGAGTYIYRLGETPMYYENLGTPFEAHGFLQKIGSEMGLLGLFFYIALIWVLALPLWRAYKSVKNQRDKIIIVLAALVVILSAFYQVFNTNYYSAKMWIPLTLAVILVKFYNEKNACLEIEIK